MDILLTILAIVVGFILGRISLRSPNEPLLRSTKKVLGIVDAKVTSPSQKFAEDHIFDGIKSESESI